LIYRARVNTRLFDGGEKKITQSNQPNQENEIMEADEEYEQMADEEKIKASRSCKEAVGRLWPKLEALAKQRNHLFNPIAARNKILSSLHGVYAHDTIISHIPDEGKDSMAVEKGRLGGMETGRQRRTAAEKNDREIEKIWEPTKITRTIALLSTAMSESYTQGTHGNVVVSTKKRAILEELNAKPVKAEKPITVPVESSGPPVRST
jgi:hypothetical protein